jgi:hypothetical protein
METEGAGGFEGFGGGYEFGGNYDFGGNYEFAADLAGSEDAVTSANWTNEREWGNLIGVYDNPAMGSRSCTYDFGNWIGSIELASQNFACPTVAHQSMINRGNWSPMLDQSNYNNGSPYGNENGNSSEVSGWA